MDRRREFGRICRLESKAQSGNGVWKSSHGEAVSGSRFRLGALAGMDQEWARLNRSLSFGVTVHDASLLTAFRICRNLMSGRHGQAILLGIPSPETPRNNVR